MPALLVTPCTNRKLGSARNPALHAGQLETGSQEEVSAQWVSLVQESPSTATASNLYGGRGFKEALAATNDDHARLWIISAGLGLVQAQTPCPTYNLTITPGSSDSVQRRVSRGTFRAGNWWAELNKGLRGDFGLASLVRAHPESTVVITLSAAYADLVLDDLLRLDAIECQRIRIVGPRSPARLNGPLRDAWMPYDTRFDGPDSPLPGTGADYPQRVARHFVSLIEHGGTIADARAHANAVLDALRDFAPPSLPDRTRADDETLCAVIRKRWDDANGSGARMLRIIRDEEGLRCEQGRFASLFRRLKESRQ